jgi:ABC-type branched-subunit amino acid transport system substrate-binding protein
VVTLTFWRICKLRLCAAAIAGACLVSPLIAGGLSPLEKQGREIYRGPKGSSTDQVVAVMGKDLVEVPATIVPCVGCHGHDGLGRVEGGVIPSNITWDVLSKPYPVKRADGREHPPYDERSLKRAFTMGIDPGGNELHLSMPRYRMTHKAAEALVAYLKTLGSEPAPGVDDTRVRLGVILPPAGPLNGMGDVIRQVLSAYADQISRRGGIYGRRVEMVFLVPPPTPDARLEAIRSFLERDDIFALTASFLSGADQAVASLVQELEVPLLAAFNLHPFETLTFHRYIFAIGPGLGEQARASLEFAADELRGLARRAAVAYAREPGLGRVAQEMLVQGTRQGSTTLWSSIQLVDYGSVLDVKEFAQNQKRLGTDVVFFLGAAADALALLSEARELDWQPYLFLYSSLLGTVVLGELGEHADRVFLSFPAWPSQGGRRRDGLYEELSDRYGLARQHLSIQLTSLGAAAVTSEALRRAGRNLTREKLVDILEQLDRYETGLIPRISYGPNRHIGALGGYVVSFGRDQVKSEWVELPY